MLSVANLFPVERRCTALGIVLAVVGLLLVAGAGALGGAGFAASLVPETAAELMSRTVLLVLLPLLGVLADRNCERERRAKQRLEALLDAVPDMLFRFDADNRYVDFRAPDPGLLAVPPHEFLGRTVEQVLGKELAEAMREVVRRTLATGEPEVWEYELLIAGRSINFECRFSAAPGGQVVAISRDVSQRKRVEQELVRSEARLAEAQRIAKIGTWERDFVTGAVWWSDEVYRLLGYEPGAITPSFDSFLESVHPDDRGVLRGRVEAARRGNTNYEMDHRVIWPDGSERVLHDRAVVICDDAGVRLRFLGTLQDVTQRVQLEKEVTAVADRERARIARDLHDGVQQTLTGIALGLKGLAQKACAESSADLEEIGSYAAAVQDAIGETRRVVRRLSDTISTGTTLGAALEALAQETSEHSDVTCTCVYPPREPLADREVAMQVYRIAQEAVTNALKHGSPQQIELHYRADGSRWILEVLDDGSGISTVAQVGDGLGLENMRFRARMIGGELSIERRRGRGTRVVCTIPCAAVRAHRAEHDVAERLVP